MSDTLASLSRKITRSGDLQAIVRTTKAMAALNIGQYEQSVSALANYARAVELGLGASFRAGGAPSPAADEERPPRTDVCIAVVFGSDQGLVGRFNDVVADYAVKALEDSPVQPQVWAVGERVHACLADAGLPAAGLFDVPVSIRGITALIGQILLSAVTPKHQDGALELRLFHNSPAAWAVYAPVVQRLLPLDEAWRRELAERAWPTENRPEVVGSGPGTLLALVREYLFVSLFRACAESLASENASRLAAMERADKNIGEMLEALRGQYNGLRQSNIDEELFDVISGFEALAKPRRG